MNWEKAKSKRKYLMIPIYTACYAFSRLAGVRCIWDHFLHFPCPGCGFTRAVISTFKLDLRQAWHYHPMFWSFFPLVLLFIFEGEVFKKRIINIIVVAAIAIGFLIVWICKLCRGIRI